MRPFFFILLVFTLTMLTTTRAQIVFDLENVDVIRLEDDGALSFFEKKGKKYRQILMDEILKGGGLYDSLLLVKKEWMDASDVFTKSDRLIKVRDIRPYSAEELLDYLDKHRFEKTITQKIKYYNEEVMIGIKVQLYNPYVLSFTLEDKNDNLKGYHRQHLDDFFIFRLKKNKHIIYGMNFNWYFIPAKDKEYIYKTLREVQSYIEDIIFQEPVTVSEDLNKNWNYDVSRNGWPNFFLSYEERIENGQMILAYQYYPYPGSEILPGEYDNIYSETYYIITTKDKLSSVYDPHLELISDSILSYNLEGLHFRFQQFYGQSHTEVPVLYFLKGDSVHTINLTSKEVKYSDHYHNEHWVDRKVSKTDNMFYLMTNYDSRESLKYSNTCYLDEESRNNAEKKRYCHYNNVIQFPGEIPDTVYYSISRFSTCFLSARKEKSTGLYSFECPTAPCGEIRKYPQLSNGSYLADTITVQEHIPMVLDSIVVDERNFRGLRQLLIYKDGLVGIYPHNNLPRYKGFEPIKGGFIRFTLPGGQTGWLNLFNGEEFLN